jgi:uncharacterized protein (DUF427 family)
MMAEPAVTADRDYPQMIAEVDHVEPAPRRVRAMLGGELIFDTTRALYVWEWPYYPQYYIPVEDVNRQFVVDERHEQRLRQGAARRHGLRAGEIDLPGTVRVFGQEAIDGVGGTARFDWEALDAWYEEDEQVFVHPRSPYVRVDALRSHRHVRASLQGITLADSARPVLVFETGLPTRYYFDRTDVDFGHLVPTGTRTACPYKGVTGGYWSVRLGDEVRDGDEDLGWAYDFPTRQLAPIAGLIAFYNERIDIDVDDVRLPRARTHFFT